MFDTESTHCPAVIVVTQATLRTPRPTQRARRPNLQPRARARQRHRHHRYARRPPAPLRVPPDREGRTSALVKRELVADFGRGSRDKLVKIDGMHV